MPNQAAEKREKDLTFTANYELTSLMTQEAASLMYPSGVSNPGYMATMVGLTILVVYCAFFDANTIIAIIGVVICVALMYLGQRWNSLIVKRLNKEGFDVVAMPERLRDFTVRVWPGGVTVERPNAEELGLVEFAPGDVKKVVKSDKLILATMRDGRHVLIPRKALSETRFNNCYQELKEFADGKKEKE
jgi:hypothetical protein